MMPTNMTITPPNVSIHPNTERPSKNNKPMPSSSGISDTPKALYPHSVQYPLVTVTRLRNRYPPAITIPRPKTNWPTPPGVPPAPRILSFSSICYCPFPWGAFYFARNDHLKKELFREMNDGQLHDQLFDQLADAAAACVICERMRERRAVLSRLNGSLAPLVMFIAEAPGRNGADRTRIPFHGDTSGRNFESLLASIKLTRDEIFITNAVLCSPRKPSGANDKPTRSEIRNCSDFLRRHIDLINR